MRDYLMYLYLATGFMGGLTAVFQVRWLYRRLVTPPTVGAHFSPKGGCTEAIVRELNRARKQILIQAYSFTSKPIADALIQAKKRGVDIEILLDRSNEQETYTELSHLMDGGIHPLIDAHHAIAHNKVMIIDRRTLITGSFNFTQHAETDNAENMLVIKGHRDLVKSYFDSFAAHKAHCQAPGTAKPGPAAHSSFRRTA